MSTAERDDILRRSGFFPAPPSNQGKWFALSRVDAARWARQLYPPDGSGCHLIEVDVPAGAVAPLFQLSNLDSVGPAVFADVDELPALNAAIVGLTEVPMPASGGVP